MKHNFSAFHARWYGMVLIILAVLFYSEVVKFPNSCSGIGQGIREFNDAKNNVKKEIEDGMSEKEKQTSSSSSTHQLICIIAPVFNRF